MTPGHPLRLVDPLIVRIGSDAPAKRLGSLKRQLCFPARRRLGYDRGMKSVDCTHWWTRTIRLFACIVLAKGIVAILADTVIRNDHYPKGEIFPGLIMVVVASVMLKISPRTVVNPPAP